MSYSKYKSLVNYITRVGDPNDKNKSFKYLLIKEDFLLSAHKYCQSIISIHISFSCPTNQFCNK